MIDELFNLICQSGISLDEQDVLAQKIASAPMQQIAFTVSGLHGVKNSLHLPALPIPSTFHFVYILLVCF